MKLLSILLIVFVSMPLLAADDSVKTPDVQQIVEKANIVAYYQADDGKSTVNMVITDKQGQKREREFNIIRKDEKDGGDQKYFVYFTKPADVRKMTYMVLKHTDPGKDDDRSMYLPNLSLTKRIAAGDKRTSFVGSDFLYEDVSGRGIEEDTHELMETTDKYYVIKNIPKAPDTVEFSYYTVTIDKTNYVPMKMDFYDKEGKLYRVIESLKIETIDNLPTVTKSKVSDLKSGSTTEMEFSKVQYNIGIGDIFTERYLQRPPKEALR